MSTHTNTNIEHDAATAVDKAQDVASEIADETKQKVSETTTAAKEQAKRVVSQVGEQAKSTVETRKGEVAQELSSVADVVRQTTYEAGASPTVMEYGQKIADQIEGVSSYFNNHGVEDILADAQDFGRRQPALFLGGAFMLGLVVGRFLRSSSDRDFNGGEDGYDRYQTDYSDSGYRQTGYTGYEGRTSYSTPSTGGLTSQE